MIRLMKSAVGGGDAGTRGLKKGSRPPENFVGAGSSAILGGRGLPARA